MEDRLFKFSHLIDAGSFTKAAHELHISQPALSMAIQKLERELRAPLYVRGSQPLALTAAGEYAYKTAKEVDASVRYLRLGIEELAKRELSLSIGMIDSVADAVLARKRNLQTLEKQAKVSLVINNSRYLLGALERGDIDVALIVEQGRSYSPHFAVRHVGSEPLVLTAHAKQADYIRHQIEVGAVTAFVSYDPPSYTHARIAQFFTNHQVELSPQFYSSSPDAILHLLLAQKGAAALPYGKIRTALKKQTIVPIGLAGEVIITRRIICVTRQNYAIPHIVHEAITQLGNDLHEMLKQAQAL